MKAKAAVILSVLLISAVYLVSRRSIAHKAPDFRDAPQDTSALRSLGETNPAAVAEEVKIPDVSVAAPVALNADVYQSLLKYKCKDGGKKITDYGARKIAELAAQDKIDVEAFKEAYYRNCDYNSALKVGLGNKSGSVSADVYQSLLKYRCKDLDKITDYGARKIAELAAQDKIDVEAFKEAYYRNCDYDSALKVGLDSRMASKR